MPFDVWFSEILLFLGLFFMTPCVLLISALHDSKYTYEPGFGWRKTAAHERRTHWIKCAYGLIGGWVFIGTMCLVLKIFA